MIQNYAFNKPDEGSDVIIQVSDNENGIYYHGTCVFFSEQIENGGFVLEQPYINFDDLKKVEDIGFRYQYEFKSIVPLMIMKGVTLTKSARCALRYASRQLIMSNRFSDLLHELQGLMVSSYFIENDDKEDCDFICNMIKYLIPLHACQGVVYAVRLNEED